MKRVVVFVSEKDSLRVNAAIMKTGRERFGNYTKTVYAAGATGTTGVMRAVTEEKFEFACDDDTYRLIVEAISAAAPSGAAIDSWPLETL